MPNQEPLLSVQIPRTLYQQLASYQVEHQLMSISDAAIAILKAHFEPAISLEPYAPLKRVAELEQQMVQLMESVKQLQRQPLYHAVSYVQIPAHPPHAVNLLTDDEITDDETEDEPDEILYDFLPTDA